MTDDPGDAQRHIRPSYEPLKPAASEAGGPEPGTPWEQRAWLGFWRGLWRAFRLFVTQPAEGFGMTRDRGPWRDPIFFALAVMFVAGTVGGVVESLVELALQGWSTGQPAGEPFPLGLSIGDRNLDWLPVSILSLGGCLLGLLVGLPLGMVFLTLFLLVGSGILHLSLAAVGGLKSSTAGYRGTLQVVCYGSVAICAYPVPWVGVWIYFLWGLALQALGFSIVHRTGRKRALVAAVLPLASLMLLALGLKALGIVFETGPE